MRIVLVPAKFCSFEGSGFYIDAGLGERNPRCNEEMRLSLRLALGEKKAKKTIFEILHTELEQKDKDTLSEEEIAKINEWWENP